MNGSIKKKREAIRKYIEFVSDATDCGRREDLTGGGLRRSAGGWEGVSSLKRTQERWQGDERILGDGVFVQEVLNISEEHLQKRERLKKEGWTLDKVAETVCRHYGIERKDIRKRGRANKISGAKAIISYHGVRELGIKGSEVAVLFGCSRAAINRLVLIGEQMMKESNLKLLF